MVWKHSYLQVGALTEDMKYFSKTLEPCYNLNVGWCNFPCKERLRPTEMAIAAYHEGTMVYLHITSTATVTPFTTPYLAQVTAVGMTATSVHQHPEGAPR